MSDEDGSLGVGHSAWSEDGAIDLTSDGRRSRKPVPSITTDPAGTSSQAEESKHGVRSLFRNLAGLLPKRAHRQDSAGDGECTCEQCSARKMYWGEHQQASSGHNIQSYDPDDRRKGVYIDEDAFDEKDSVRVGATHSHESIATSVAGAHNANPSTTSFRASLKQHIGSRASLRPDQTSRSSSVSPGPTLIRTSFDAFPNGPARRPKQQRPRVRFESDTHGSPVAESKQPRPQMTGSHF